MTGFFHVFLLPVTVDRENGDFCVCSMLLQPLLQGATIHLSRCKKGESPPLVVACVRPLFSPSAA